MRNTLKYVGEKNKKEFANDLKTIYHAPSEDAALEQLERVTEKWEKDYPNAMKSWYKNWDVISPIFKFSAEVRKVIYITNAIEAQQYLAGNPIDLIFVDINMPDLSGVEFVRSLVSRPMIIFTTAYSEYAVEGFKLDAIDYLLKPFSFADFSRSAAKAQSLYELLAYRKTQGNAPAPEATPRDREYISIKADYKTTLVRISDIVYLESEGEYVRLHLDDRSTITTLFRLKNMEAALPSEMFMRVHRSYIVNLQRIRSYVKGRVFVSDSEYIPIGENYRETFQRYIETHYQNL